jgi:peptidoglycan/LPS O-acetylase OafA/YrhL
VSLFFALSGLLMTKILFVGRVPLPTFYRRRISRIFPALFGFLAMVIAAYAVTGRAIVWSDICAATTFTTNYFPALSRTQMPTGHIWSLSVEEHSYILLSMLAVMVRFGYIGARTALGYFIALFAGIALIYFTLAPADLYLRVRQSEVAALTVFASGWVLLYRSGVSWVPGPFVAPCMLLLALALQWWSVPGAVRVIAGGFSLAVSVNSLATAHPKFLATLSFAPLRQMGLWSYSIYLWQQPFFLMQDDGLPSWRGLLMAVACGLASYYLIERPSRAYLNRVWTGRSASAMAEPAPT